MDKANRLQPKKVPLAMPLNNGAAILVLAVLFGFLSNLGVIGAKAYLLSITDPVYVVVISVSAVIAFANLFTFCSLYMTKNI